MASRESIIEKACNWAAGIANDNSHGYSQSVRFGPSYDCSSLVLQAYQQAGVPVRDKGGSYTGNLLAAFLACGFKDVSRQVNLVAGTGLERGDVLLYHNNGSDGHTVLYIGNRQVVNARSSEGTSDTIDNSGNEIRIQAYWNYPWQYCLRMQAEPTTTIPTATPIEVVKPGTSTKVNDVAIRVPQLQINDKGIAVRMLQAMLIAKGYSCGVYGADGDFGVGTKAAVMRFQKDNGLTQDGIVGIKTWQKLLTGE